MVNFMAINFNLDPTTLGYFSSNPLAAILIVSSSRVEWENREKETFLEHFPLPHKIIYLFTL